jgi:hypothetical protein
MATPGEMVDVRTPGQQSGSKGNGGGFTMNVDLRGTETVSRNKTKEIFEMINQGIRDGYTLQRVSMVT